MINYYFSIAGTTISVQVPYALKISDSTVPFLCDYVDNPDYRFLVRGVTDILDDISSGIWQDEHHFSENSEGFSVCHYHLMGKKPYARVYGYYNQPKVLFCEYLLGCEKRICCTRDIVNLLGIEYYLLKNNGLLLHASFIKWKDKGILFAAPSGTGKSTQAELWKNHQNADIINGDRAAVCHQKEKWVGWGLPVAGTSGIYRNESAPISAVVVLRQAKRNAIRLLYSGEAFRYLYPEISIHRWDVHFTDDAVNLILQFMHDVPVYLLECLPDQNAVQLLKNTMEKEE